MEGPVLDGPYRKEGDHYGDEEKEGGEKDDEEEDREEDDQKEGDQEAQIVLISHLHQEDIPRTHVVGGFRSKNRQNGGFLLGGDLIRDQRI